MHSWLFRNRHRLMQIYGISPVASDAGTGSWDGDPRHGMQRPDAPTTSERWPSVERPGTGEVVLFPAVQPRVRDLKRGA